MVVLKDFSEITRYVFKVSNEILKKVDLVIYRSRMGSGGVNLRSPYPRFVDLKFDFM